MGSKSGRKRRERERRKLEEEPGAEALAIKPLEELLRSAEKGRPSARPGSEDRAPAGESLVPPIGAEAPLDSAPEAIAGPLAGAEAGQSGALSPEASSAPAPAGREASARAPAEAPATPPRTGRETPAEGPRLVHTGLLWPPLSPPRAAAYASLAPAPSMAASPLPPAAPSQEAPALELAPAVLRDLALQIWHWDDRQRSAQRFAHARALRVWRLRLTLACATLAALFALALLLWARYGGPRP